MAILEAARAEIADSRLEDISIRRIAERSGLSKTNVLHYFPSREAIFLDLLDTQWGEWLDELARAIPASADAGAVARGVAETLAKRPQLCELSAALNSVLERNIPLEVAVDFKARAVEHHHTLAHLLEDALGLTPVQAEFAAAATLVLVAGLWPFCNPTAVVRQACEQLALRDPAGSFEVLLAAALTAQLTGVAAQENVIDIRPDASRTE